MCIRNVPFYFFPRRSFPVVSARGSPASRRRALGRGKARPPEMSRSDSAVPPPPGIYREISSATDSPAKTPAATVRAFAAAKRLHWTSPAAPQSSISVVSDRDSEPPPLRLPIHRLSPCTGPAKGESTVDLGSITKRLLCSAQYSVSRRAQSNSVLYRARSHPHFSAEDHEWTLCRCSLQR
jgi:hypothetical protein